MLELINITKDYPMADGAVHALRGVSLNFRKSEFVSILGASGCGKTTLLNIIGGLDKYTSGDIVIGGVSTKKYGDRDWDAYRNHSIGFIFQSYNLIPHQTVLANVELSLTLSGVSKEERKKRAKEALEEVGLGEQINKLPKQLSGGQMQRVAIARALVNNPEIVLADEPTGALDSETGVQVMEVLKNIAQTRLVIMVTHNPELADTYSTRIIRLKDGEVIDDTNPFLPSEEPIAEVKAESESISEDASETASALPATPSKRKKKPSMSFFTAVSLSFRNLMTKKRRTAMVSFAGSIGIIGIALILSVSQGMTSYINHVQESTLSTYPLTLETQTVDMSSLIESFMNVGKGELTHDKDAIYKDPVIGELVNALSKIETGENDLAAFKTYLETELTKADSPLKAALSGIQYSYSMNLSVYTEDPDGTIIKSDTASLMMEMLSKFMLASATGNSSGSIDASALSGGSMGSSMSNPMMQSMMKLKMWQEILPSLDKKSPINDVLKEQYDVIHGAWPNEKDEIVLVVNENNELDDLTLYALGLLTREEIDGIVDAAVRGEELPTSNQKWSYEDLLSRTYKVIFPYEFYSKDGDVYKDMSENDTTVKLLYKNAMELKIVGILRPKENVEAAMLTGAIGYTHLLTEHVIQEAANAQVVKDQLASPNTDVLTGLPFRSNTGVLTDAEKETAFRSYLENLDAARAAAAYVTIQCLKAEAAQLEPQVQAALDNLSVLDKSEIIKMISQYVSQEMDMSAEELEAMFADMTKEELLAMLKPYLQEMMRQSIHKAVMTAMGVAVPAEDNPLVLTEEQIAMYSAALTMEAPTYTQADCALYYDNVTEFSDMTYEETLVAIGCLDLNTPSKINLFATSFENKDIIVDAISRYNNSVDESKKIAYTDYLGIMMSSITTIINAITYVLIAFVAISLVVSSIMIGVITLISVQERTKEIGILRSLGASKRNVSGMFNAETMIIGLASGLLGVGVTYLLCIPINAILEALTGLPNLKAYLPWEAALLLVAISVLLTLFSGIIPSRSAAKKDPVIALRTE